MLLQKVMKITIQEIWKERLCLLTLPLLYFSHRAHAVYKALMKYHYKSLGVPKTFLQQYSSMDNVYNEQNLLHCAVNHFPPYL
jgi:hypothetical protein